MNPITKGMADRIAEILASEEAIDNDILFPTIERLLRKEGLRLIISENKTRGKVVCVTKVDKRKENSNDSHTD